MKKKIISTLLILTMLLGINIIKSNATTDVCKIIIVPKTTNVKSGDTVDFEIKMSNVTDTNGLAGYAAKISFDTNVFTYSKILGCGEWETPIYNEGYIATTVASGKGQTANQTIAILTLRVNEGVTSENSKVSVSEMTTSNGIKTFDISSAETTVKITNNNTNNNANNNNANNNNTNNNNTNNNITNNNITNNTKNNTKNNKENTTKNDKNNITANILTTTTSNKEFPYAGIFKKVIIFSLIILGITGGVSYYKYKKYSI